MPQALKNKAETIKAFGTFVPTIHPQQEVSVMDVTHTYLLTFNADGSLDAHGSSENIPDDAQWSVPVK